MKKSLLGIVFIFVLVGCGKHVQPAVDSDNVAFITIEEYMPFDNGYGLETSIYIGNKLISELTNTRVSTGKHILSMEVTAFYNRLAKYGEVKNLQLNFKSNSKYTIKIMSDKEFYDDIRGNANIKIIVYENRKIILKKNIVVENNRAKTIEKYPDLESQIGTILTAVL